METRFYSSSRLKLRKPSELEQDDIRFICIRVSRLVWRETEGRLVQENMQKDETERKHQAWRTRTKTLSRLIKENHQPYFFFAPCFELNRCVLRSWNIGRVLKQKTKCKPSAFLISRAAFFQLPKCPPLELEHVRTKFSVFFLLKYKGEKSINDFSSLRLSSWCM